jgi:hypothetical protein
MALRGETAAGGHANLARPGTGHGRHHPRSVGSVGDAAAAIFCASRRILLGNAPPFFLPHSVHLKRSRNSVVPFASDPRPHADLLLGSQLKQN